ncbi:cytoskeletal protein RodZ [Croceibacterium atlanticum]|uniref:Cytoskeletal protein RodZ n=2 Tax=Croceibacterium atlanticum TaxID=1267766 RepID=A0A0F7KPV5_9SPHN|nr:helix-turn-helix domain-containing protein [Croceibacterium atlanticum]AKH42563.1 cytoskeletal protein RodZ [Croceibacterium atlanticum]
MTEEVEREDNPAQPEGIGPQLRATREARGLSLDQVAAETRIPVRHLEAIEQGDFAALPARTYAVGFSKTYAKLVGLDQEDVVAMVRAELEAQEPEGTYRTASFEPGDPARVPSSRLGLFAIFALVLLLVGGFFFMRTLFTPAAELPSLVAQEEAAEQERQAALAAAEQEPEAEATPAGPVVFTSLEEGIWVKFYDAEGRQLMQKLMAEGESYTVPADVEGPQIWTGRPDALAITIGGQEVPKLAEDDMVMRDIPVTASALLARNEEAEGASPTS